MSKVKCTAHECLYYDYGRCAARRISLRQLRIGQMFEGRKIMWECKDYKVSGRYKEIVEMLGGNVRSSENKGEQDG